MNCDEVREYLPDPSGGPRRDEVQAHLDACPECRQDLEMWHRMEAWPDEQPNPSLQWRFEATLEAYAAGLDHKKSRWFHPAAWLESWWPERPALQFAMVLVALAVGLSLGYGIAPRGSSEIAGLRQEVRNTRQLVAVSLLQQSSASERLRGVNWSYRVDRPEPEVLGALVQALKNDSSVDVRLAAADALRRYVAEPSVRQGILDGLRPPQSPLVQVALIDLAVETRLPQASRALRELSNDPSLDGAVRQRAQWGAQQF